MAGVTQIYKVIQLKGIERLQGVMGTESEWSIIFSVEEISTY